MLLEDRRDAAHHQDGLFLARLGDLHDLEAPRQRRILLDVLLVFGPGRGGDRAQRPARQRRLEQVRGITGPGRATRANQRVGLVDEQDDRLRRRLHVFDHLPQPVLEFALHARAGLQQADVERVERDVAQRRRHVAARQAQREAFHDRRLADARLARQDRIVLPAPHQDVHDLPDFLVAPADRIDLALARALGQVRGIALERFLLAQLRRGNGGARFARRRRRPVSRAHALFRRAVHDAGKVLRQRVGLDRLELPRDGDERVPERRGLQHADDEVAGPDLRVAEHQRRVDPAALDGVLDVGRQVGNRRGTSRQTIQRIGDVLREPRGVDLEVLQDAMQVGVGSVQDLLQPMHQLDVRIPAQLAEDGGTLDRLVCQAIELAKERRPADFAHARSTNLSASTHRSSASVSARRRPSHVVHPSCRPPSSVNGGTSFRRSSRRTSQSNSKQQ